jgi:hypothetical protein
MEPMYYIGLDVHKRKISYCVKDGGGKMSDARRIITRKATATSNDSIAA